MLSLWRSLARPSRIITVMAARSEGNFQTGTLDEITSPTSASSRQAMEGTHAREQLQATVKNKLHVMDKDQIFSSLFQYSRMTKNEERYILPRNDPLFNSLEQAILLKSTTFDVRDLLKLVRIAGSLKLDSTSLLVQNIYEKLGKHLSELDIKQLKLLRTSTERLTGTSVLTKSVEISLPTLVETCVKKGLDNCDRDACLSAVSSALVIDVSMETQDIIAKTALSFIPKMDRERAAFMLYDGAFRDPMLGDRLSPEMRLLFGELLTLIGENLFEFDQTSVRKILRAYTRAGIYNRKMENALWSVASASDKSEILELASMSLKTRSFTVNKANHLKDWLLEHSEEFTENTVNYRTFTKSCYAMALLAAQSSESNESFKTLGQLFARALEKDSKRHRTPDVYTNILLNIAILGVYPERDLALLFSEPYQKKIVSPFLAARLCLIEQCLRLRFGDSCPYVVVPALRMAGKTVLLRTSGDHGLTESLRTALGGDQYVLSNLKTPLGAEADFALVFGSDGGPIARAGEHDPLKELPKGCKVLAILMDYPNRCYLENAPQMKTREFALNERFLKMQNIYPLTIRMDEWQSLPTHQRLPFLAKTIEEALSEAEPARVI